jgi:Uma2 family endonuclease
MSSLAVERSFSPKEYLSLERAAETKHEYFNGRIYARPSASRAHSIIAINILGEFGSQLRGHSCEAYGSDMRVNVSDTGLYTYPDASVACGEIKFADSVTDTLLTPTLLVEVLSKSTEAYDRGDKFAHYRRIPSLKEVLLVSQDRPRIERFVRQDEEWILTEFSGMEAVMDLPSIGCKLALQEVYDKVQFPPVGAETLHGNGAQ